jgi:senataxin
MHPEIAFFPSTFYYQSRLVNGAGLASETSRPWHSLGFLGPYRFFDVPGQEEKRTLAGGQSSKSTMNTIEAQMVVLLIAFLCHQFPAYNFSQKIGIITPYKEQKRKIQRELMKRFGNDSQLIRQSLEVSTVDGFQGQEREIIIFSCVRTGRHSGGVGFLSDARRINVALTRAKASLFVLGRADSLSKNGLWRALIEDARQRGLLAPYDDATWRRMRESCGSVLGSIPSNLRASSMEQKRTP